MTINDIRCGSGFYNWTEYRERATQAQIWTENGHRIPSAYCADRYAMRITFQKPGSPYHVIFCAGEER